MLFSSQGIRMQTQEAMQTYLSKFELGVQNEAGQRLIQFCQENTLVIANTLLQQHKRPSTLEYHQMVNKEIRLVILFAVEDGETLSVQFSCSVMSDSLQTHESHHARPPCPSSTPGVHLNPYPLSQWWHPAILCSVGPFSSCPQSLPASGSFQMSQLFASGGQSIGVSASTSVLPMNTQDWSPLGWTGWISLQSKGLSRVFSTPQFKSINSLALSFLHSPTHIHTWPQEKP